jgi:hypothetical protein
MPEPMLRGYVQALPGLIAEYEQVLVKAAAFPWVDKETRERWESDWERVQQAGRPKTPPLSPEMVRGQLAMLGIGLVSATRKEANDESG